MIRVDKSERSALAWCPACPSWRELRAERAAALTAGADHVQLVHGNAALAAELRKRAAAATQPTRR